jgi:hypothetical protein
VLYTTGKDSRIRANTTKAQVLSTLYPAAGRMYRALAAEDSPMARNNYHEATLRRLLAQKDVFPNDVMLLS